MVSRTILVVLFSEVPFRTSAASSPRIATRIRSISPVLAVTTQKREHSSAPCRFVFLVSLAYRLWRKREPWRAAANALNMVSGVASVLSASRCRHMSPCPGDSRAARLGCTWCKGNDHPSKCNCWKNDCDAHSAGSTEVRHADRRATTSFTPRRLTIAFN